MRFARRKFRQQKPKRSAPVTSGAKPVRAVERNESRKNAKGARRASCLCPRRQKRMCGIKGRRQQAISVSAKTEDIEIASFGVGGRKGVKCKLQPTWYLQYRSFPTYCQGIKKSLWRLFCMGWFRLATHGVFSGRSSSKKQSIRSFLPSAKNATRGFRQAETIYLPIHCFSNCFLGAVYDMIKITLLPIESA